MKQTPLSFHRIAALVCAGCLIAFTAHAQTPEADAQKKLQAKFEAAKVKALAGDPDAQYNLAECYRRGKGVAANPEEMMKWYLKSAQLNNAAAQYSLGQCYAKPPGPFLKQDLVEAYAWMTVAHGITSDFTPGMSPAQLEAGKKRALVLEKQLEKQTAEADLRRKIPTGEEATKQDQARQERLARDFQEWKVKADAGDTFAQVRVAELYKTGGGVAESREECEKYYLKAAMLGSGEAQSWVAQSYEFPVIAGHKPDPVEWYAWTLLSQTSSHPDTNGTQRGIWRSPQQIAAGTKRAQALAAQIEANLKTIPAKPKPAASSPISTARAQTVDAGLKAKADAGDAAAQFQLFEMYRDGKGVKRDLNESNKWLFKSALFGNADAQDIVAGKYLNEWKDSKVEAYGWMSVIAKRNGIRSPGGPQDAFAQEKGLTPQQVAAGKKCAEELLAEIEANRKTIEAAK